MVYDFEIEFEFEFDFKDAGGLGGEADQIQLIALVTVGLSKQASRAMQCNPTRGKARQSKAEASERAAIVMMYM